DVDPHLEHGLDSDRIDLLDGHRPGRADLDAVPGEVAQPAGSHLGTAGVVDADEQDGGRAIVHICASLVHSVMKMRRSRLTRVAMSSRRAASPSGDARAGSPTAQSSYRTPGTTGQASPQPMVTTTSAARMASSVSGLGNASSAASRSISATRSRTCGWTPTAGVEPADRAITLPPDKLWVSAAASWDRPALATQTNRTCGGAVAGSRVRSASRCRAKRSVRGTR